MSLTTRCPACGTVFRVVPDQLKVSEGWVRCGRCSEVFDARVTLVSQLPVVTEVVESPAAESPANPLPAAETTAETATETATETTAETAAETAATEATAIEAEPPAESSESSPAAAPSTPAPAPATATATADQVSFVRQARRRALWRRPAVRGVLVALALLLTGVLAGQLAYHHRDALAQQVPALRPALEALCQPLQCRIGPPRRIEAVTIESSGFTRLQPDTFRLQLTLSNGDRLPVALPALELTLTDSQDQPVIRRVLQAADLGPEAPAALPANAEWATSITLTVSPFAGAAITGYRLLAFYP